MNKCNDDIRRIKGDIPYWLIADRLGVHEVTFIRWMRKELSPSLKTKVVQAIGEIKKNQEKELGN
jgi:hypothetical protein